MRAMILAAGYGTRLWPLTIDRAKPAIPFMTRPLVGYVAEYLAGYGCRDVVVNLHHQPDSVRAALGDGSRFGVRLHYVEETSILGTSGALDNARALLEGETFIVINGKIATDINLAEAIETHRRTNAIATLVARKNIERDKYSTVVTRGEFLEGFGATPLASDNAGGASRSSLTMSEGSALLKNAGRELAGSAVINQAGSSKRVDDESVESSRDEDEIPLMFTGIQIVEPRIFSYIPRGVFSHSTTDVYPQAIARGERIAVHVAAGYWHELSTVKRYLETSLLLLKKEHRDVECGANSIIEEGADVRDSVLWESVRVESGARVRRAILGDGVVIPAGEIVENAAVVRAELIKGIERPQKGLAGEVRGANFVAPLAQ